ncbi:hypothetical protein [uncultured Porphyromonas sp.]|mgnify:CR=1 FL=1|uniref:hypothetical protein n=1 Tax=uncultured Porphyromonas sp. TaxID=159274 RepID=UPI0026126E90|nr:hypothetical protein [uncultured Porphyromonas sp.]
MNEPQLRRYRHRDLSLVLALISLALFVLLQLVCRAITPSHRWLFMLSFFTPTFIGLTLGAYCAQRHGLDKAIIALGTAGIALIGIALLGMIDLLFSPLG